MAFDSDARLQFIETYTQKTLKVKNDKWQKLLSQDEQKQIIVDFVEKGDNVNLVMILQSNGIPLPFYEFPDNLKAKAVYFVKKGKIALTKETFRAQIIYGDLSNSPLEQLSALVDELLVPLLSNKRNHENWPAVVSQDVQRHVHSLKSSVFVVAGQVKGKTLLPLPVGAESFTDNDDEKADKNLRNSIHQIEGVIIGWSHQIHDVLKRKSAQALFEGLNPEPMVEIDFWESRARNLECIFDQLRSQKVRKMAEILERTESSYFNSFKILFQDVVNALKEAREITMYLKPLKSAIETVEESEFDQLEPRLAPVLHVLCLVWAHSTHYRMPSRIIVVLQEICNLLIRLATEHLSPEEIFKGESDEALVKIKFVIKVLERFKEDFEEKRSTLKEYFKETEFVPWEFASSLVFPRYNCFLARVRQLEDLVETTIEFNRLEKIEIGGVKGKALSKQIENLYIEFTEFVTIFQNITYNCLDIKEGAFKKDFEKFKEKIEYLDLRLASIINQGFDDCGSLEAVLKMLDAFGSLLDRPIIRKDSEPKYPLLIQMYETELDTTKKMFDLQNAILKETSTVVLHVNMPFVAGVLQWCQGMRERISLIRNKLIQLNHGAIESAEAVIVFQKYDQMMQLLLSFEMNIYSDWTSQVGEVSELNLDLPLLTRSEESKLISVNFDPQLVSVLREVRYLESVKRDDIEIPGSAANIYAKNDLFRQYLANLDLIVNRYNKVRETILDVEFPLIEGQLSHLDVQLDRAITSLNWKSEAVWDYIEETRKTTGDLELRVSSAKDNVDSMNNIMAKWCDFPLYERKEKRGLLNLDDRKTTLESRYNLIRNDGTKIQEIVVTNLGLFKATEDSDHWRNYLDYIDDMILDGFFNAVQCSLAYLLENTETGAPDILPLMEARLELAIPEMVFVPSLEFGSEDGFMELIEGIVDDAYKLSSLIPRIAKHNGMDHYQIELDDMLDLSEMRHDLMDRVSAVINKAIEQRNQFENYSYLWTENRAEFLRQFLLYNHVLTQEEIENAGEEGVPECKPTLEQFKEQMDTYETLYDEVAALPDVYVFDQWFRLSIRPFKQNLLNVVRKWSLMFKTHLIDHVTNSLKSLQEFIKKTTSGLSVEVQDGDYEGLVGCMGHLLNVRDRTATTDEMFEPLKQTIDLLKSYDHEMSEEVHQQLQELPEQWNNVKKQGVMVKQQVAPLQANEVAIIRRKCTSFDVKQHEFREMFRKEAPFKYDSAGVYANLDQMHIKIGVMEFEMQGLADSASLFEVNMPEFKQLKQCRKEVKLLKTCWDMTELVTSCFDDWKLTLWIEIDVESMEVECKKFVKEIRGMDKEMRAWDVYSGLESDVKNMVTSLRAVTELQNPAIRERHWLQLMQTTKVRFIMDDKTTLDDLLALNLHNFEEEVRNIVDKATKELNMEKVLKELDSTWSVMEFEHDAHLRTETPLLRSSEELIETLEDNQVQLQNLMTSKYIAYFLEEVSSWQTKLSTADSVIQIWFEVQRTWSHLESIFIGSEDIRKQLPEDSKRFDGIDSDFKELMEAAVKTPNVIEATCQPGLFAQLEDLQDRLALCEKALAEYLETKRLAFPRFYFVSSADLLDILSKGNQPLLVARHLSKLFDNLHRLEFETENEEFTKKALGMYSGEGEYVPFKEEVWCTGPVESWLNKIMEMSQNTINSLIAEGVITYEEKAREHWLFDYPAQVSLGGNQIWWTTEVKIGFGRLEEGYENALKDYNKKQISQLITLVQLLIGELSKQDRQKICTICTIDVHNRDVVAKLIAMKAENAQEFAWLSQIKHRWDEKKSTCFVDICDAMFTYSNEYLGNTPRLVITPLTDRCYITLTQSLHLTMSGAPAGPAGTGKTETTKDLGRALGIMVYVFNCSEQMDYKSIGNIYKGLSQAGAWGCFDEFNRISIEVLSVVAVQVKCIQDAIRDKLLRFTFQGEEISLIPSVGIFITMNPGYAGRTELPENLKALFRPCAMVVPDFGMICEIMLMSEGFIDARVLARKFITLYTLCRELLSKQDHYDWGLRAIKSVLVVAGALKRGDRGRPENEVLMRALRDFNIPKIITDDMPVFMGLIGDLFPGLDVPRKRDLDNEAAIKRAALDLKLQPEDQFILKVVQFEELLAVRHSVFVIGNAGTGKTQLCKVLYRTYVNLKRKPVWADLNPKAVTNDELFGYINPSTREWKDGLFSCIMRDQSNITHDGPKWIVLDGDIDPMWIESLNTVMDDNKVLTLASNERVPLTPSMRLVFEIGHLKAATPATVSRAGILYINQADLGWNPFVTSWIDTREVQSEKANLIILFEKYVAICLETLKSRFKKITPIVDISMIKMLCYLLEGLLVPENTPPDCNKELYELYFVFAAVWAFGGAMFQDQLVDYRSEFSKWWCSEFKTIKFPSQGTVFDYYIDSETKKFNPWSDAVPKFIYDPELPLQATLVATAETHRLSFFLDLLMKRERPVMLVGSAGTGKTVLMNALMRDLGDDYTITLVPFNNYTSSMMLQSVLEKPLEKKAGRNYGPPGSKKLIYFIDDMNMPEVDEYGTVAPHTLIRQHIDYSHWYDRAKMTLKDVHNTQYVSCMNPTAGSFTINPRLQRHFCVFAVSFPGHEAQSTIYSSILTGHLELNKFPAAVKRVADKVIQASIQLHSKINSTFLPTAIKFHYIFNLRDLSNIYQGILYSVPDVTRTAPDIIQLWMHEASRVYRDKLIEYKDIETYDKLTVDLCRKIFEDIDESVFKPEVNIYTHFSNGIGELKYAPITNYVSLNKILVEALENYNEMNSMMNLVLFRDAMEHICRINRILESPRGNALLVGVGGSGKQSLARLSAFISNLEVFQITLRKGYGLADLKVDIAGLYMKAGVKNVPTMFLMTDSQVPDDKFLVLINDLLASGEIPELFAEDEVADIIGAMRNEVKAAGIMDSLENCWTFFIDRIRTTLKVVLCFSPVGSTLRVRGRMFPALINCTSIDWFHEWPLEALISVSSTFLEEVDLLEEDIKPSVAEFMAHVQITCNLKSQQYLANDRRYNYTTPKSFLEQIELYKKLLGSKHSELQSKMDRLLNGLLKLQSTSSQVDDLKAKLASQEIELKQKNEDADKLIQRVGVETEKVSKEKAIADAEEVKVDAINKEVTIKASDCERDLAKAEPALAAAQEALNTLNKNNLTELKSFGQPPPAVINVVAGVLVLLSPHNKIPKDRSWKAGKLLMNKVDAFLDQLINYDKENIHENNLKAIDPYLNNPEFQPEFIKAKSAAASGLCAWVVNIVTFYRVFCDVEPKRNALAQANTDLATAQEKLTQIKSKIKELDDNLAELTASFEKATSDKLRCQTEAEATAKTISLANRLVGGLASENVRWAESVDNFKVMASKLPGDVLLITAFISYLGYFTKNYRDELMNVEFIPFLAKQKVLIPITNDMDILNILIDDADIASWNNEGLPSDRMSTENATILCNATRWPLMVDPQLQGIKWIKQREGEELKVIRLGQKGYLDAIERAVSNGDCVLIENLEEDMDPVLDPVIGRNTVKKGRAIKIGDKEVDYSPNFRLILHTKLANPHYKPELQAQCTLINFTVTRDGLEDQLLAEVVAKERPDLEATKSQLTKQQNDFKITLKGLEDNLLSRLSAAEGNFLGDTELVENLENTKKTASEIEIQVAQAKETEIAINEAREFYRPAAARGSLLYFILNDLNKINPLYQFSLKAFNVIFHNSMERAEPAEELKIRVENLIDSLTYSVFVYTTRGLFEADKIIFTSQMTFQIFLTRKEIDPVELEFLLRFPSVPNLVCPVDFMNNHSWGAVKSLSQMDEFKNLDRDIEGSAKRWKKFVESEIPEKEKFPQEWKNKSSLQKLCMMRALRPDRMTYAVEMFVEEKLGTKYIENRSVPFEKSFEETSPETPVFFILSPGVDPLKDVEILGNKLGITISNGKLHNVSLGQGQEIVAEKAMDIACKNGGWVILQNIHLVKKWLGSLEKKLESTVIDSDPLYRVYMSAEPAATAASHIIPQGILEASIKITNEPPTGIKANVHKALDQFSQETLEMCARENEFKSLWFSLCYFHAVVCERRKFGPQGWNRSYPFNIGDLTISVNVLYNYLESNPKVPWTDLRYLFGEIMYGGHITDDWDRRLCKTYLEEYMQPEMLEGDLLLAPGFNIPGSMDYAGYHAYLDEELPPESPYLYGLHPNAEIGFLTMTSEHLFRTVLEMQPRDGGTGSGAGMTKEEKVKGLLDEIMERLPEEFNIAEMLGRTEDRTPYTVVAFQECERMNTLTSEIRRSLKELDLGLKGELTISNEMEATMNSVFLDKVPNNWTARAYPSMQPLGSWFADLLLRIKELEGWVTDFTLPNVVWLAGFFNPQSFLTAIEQSTARKNEWPLDRMVLSVDVTKKIKDDFNSAPREGAYIHGLFMEGARWDSQTGMIADSRLKELTPPMPVMFVKAVTVDRQETKNLYDCPVYKTRERGPTFVWTFNLKTKEKPAKWTVAGVALLLSA